MRSGDSPSQDAPIILKALAFKFRIAELRSPEERRRGGGGDDVSLSLVREGGVYEVGERRGKILISSQPGPSKTGPAHP